MKHLVAILIITLFLIASCTAPAPEAAQDLPSEADQELADKLKEVEEKITEVEKKVEEQKPVEEDKEQATVVVEKQPEESLEPKETPPSPVVQEQSVSTEISAEVKELLARADSKIKSFSYMLAPPPDQLARDKWLVKGTKIKVELYNDNYVEPDTYYDNIYLDTENKVADGFCLNQRTTRCAEPGQHFTLDYADTYQKSPYQWLKEISGTPKIISSEVVYDRRVSVVEYEKDGSTYRQWVDQYSGLPIRIEKDGERTSRWEFRYLAINNVLDSDLVKPK